MTTRLEKPAAELELQRKWIAEQLAAMSPNEPFKRRRALWIELERIERQLAGGR